MALSYLATSDPKRQRKVGNQGTEPAGPKEFAQILPIFLPFPKLDAVESAAPEENG